MRKLFCSLLLVLSPVAHAATLAEQNDALFKRLNDVHGLTDAQLSKMKAAFAAGAVMGQGNPDVTQHPMTREQCEDRAKKAGAVFENPQWEKICGNKYMAPLYDPATQKPEDAKTCIDQFEFPNIPCEFPVVWVKAKEAQEICAMAGKRMCDAHEWEGACAGALTPPDYAYDKLNGAKGADAFRILRSAHNAKQAKRSWSYGPAFKKGVCAQNSTKAANCNGGDWKNCGSNTYPAGSFSECHSSLGVYDLNGNAAEHMNLPTDPSESASKGSKLGHTEMKGSWFIWDKFQAHEDWCRWRAPYWHGSRVMDDHSHHNYHLSFRCCKDR